MADIIETPEAQKIIIGLQEYIDLKVKAGLYDELKDKRVVKTDINLIPICQ